MFVYSFYKFREIADLPNKRGLLISKLNNLDIKGTILLSKEGINANISQTEFLLDHAINIIDDIVCLDNIHINKSPSNYIAFTKLKVKIKNEIIKFEYSKGQKNKSKLKTISPKEWDNLLDDDVQVLDIRNSFEYFLGTFNNAISFNLRNFIDLKDRKSDLNKLDKKKKTAIFCTGGIRCEKAGKFLNDLGFEDVYQLKGGIINYMNTTRSTSWKGECFVFDDRIVLKK